jgi:hypothetical protein
MGGMSATSDVVQRAVELGARVDGHPEHVETVVPELVELLKSTDDPVALVEVIGALGRAWCSKASETLLSYTDHSDSRVRLAVAQALPHEVEGELEERVADALISLSTDASAETRDWATFGLGTQLSVDSWLVRDALFARARDSDCDTRDEAIVGLARRRDRRALDLVLDRLAEDEVGSLAFEAAALLADERLTSLLEVWADVLPDDDEISRALSACRPESQGRRMKVQEALLEAVQARLDQLPSGQVAAVWGERLSTDIHLGVDSTQLVWLVDSLLERSGGDVEEAARLVIADLATTE